MLLDYMSDVNVNLFCSKQIRNRTVDKFIYSYVAEEKYKRMFGRWVMKNLYDITVGDKTYCDMPYDVADLLMRVLKQLEVNYVLSLQVERKMFRSRRVVKH